jgi:predicted nucleotidyltransferase
MMISQKQIEHFGRQLAAAFHPEKIVLFGSYAYGRPHSDSDVDLLVIMPFDGSAVDKSVEMRMQLRPRFPLDLLVRSPAKIRERLALGDEFIRNVLAYGKVLYETSHG